jgi:hypothetical protein
MLRELHTAEGPDTSRRQRAGAGLLVAAVIVGIIVIGVMALRPGTTAAPPVAPGQPTVSATPTPTLDRQNYAFPAALSAAVPASWDKRVYSGGVDFQSPKGPGITLIMDPTPFGAGKPKDLTAESFAQWLASRPYLESTQVVATRVSGYPAWQVDVRLLDSATATSVCQPSIPDCIQMVKMPFAETPTGISHGQVGRMLFVQYPAGRIVWVYEWDAGEATADNLPGVLGVLQPVFESIQLGPITG